MALPPVDDLRRASFRRKGITFLAVGGVLFLSPILLLSLFFASLFRDPFGAAPLGFLLMGLASLLGFAGVACLGIGGYYLRLGYLRAAAEFVASETGGAFESVAEAGARGAGRGWAHSAGTVQVVRVKCRSCGFLESEDARFCSKCGKAV
jgi:hypothetical protein